MVGMMVFTAPIILAASVILSRRGMMSSLRGIVTEAPPKSEERKYL